MSRSMIVALIITVFALIIPVSCSTDPRTESFLKSDPRVVVSTANIVTDEPVPIAAEVDPRDDIQIEDLDFDWEILNEVDEAVYTASDVTEFDWIPGASGTYVVNCTVSYLDENKSVILVIVVIDKQSFLLDQYKTRIVGTWTGTATNRWREPWNVELTFFDDGVYSGRNLSDSSPAFYYGTDSDSPSKTYAIEYVMADGRAVGHIDIYFDVGTICRGDLESIQFSDNYQTLKFDFYHRGMWGPHSFNLQRSGS